MDRPPGSRGASENNPPGSRGDIQKPSEKGRNKQENKAQIQETVKTNRKIKEGKAEDVRTKLRKGRSDPLATGRHVKNKRNKDEQIKWKRSKNKRK